jgi:uncharacterized protein YndB with AHSA1/START domain
VSGIGPITFERFLPYPIESVWAALTEPRELIAWLGRADVDLELGGRFEITWLNVDDEGNSCSMRARITELDPPVLLETTTVAGDESGHGTLRWELASVVDGTRLRFTATAPSDGGTRAQLRAGWHWHLDALGASLAGSRRDLRKMEGWEEMYERYRNLEAVP